MARLAAVVAFVLLFRGAPGQAQGPPIDCAPPDKPNVIRIAVLIADLNDLPYSGVGRVSLRRVAPGDSSGPAGEPGFLDQWYCSDELPRGAYIVEVRAVNFDCTAIRISESDSGLVVRLMRLRPDPWRPRSRAARFPWVFDPWFSRTEPIGTRRCGVSAGS
jgi:hypothetical protein